jgi:hypothetical protein
LADQLAIVSAIAAAIHNARVNFPAADHGKMQDRIFEGNEDAIMFAKAVIAGLDGAGYKIVPKEKN